VGGWGAIDHRLDRHRIVLIRPAARRSKSEAMIPLLFSEPAASRSVLGPGIGSPDQSAMVLALARILRAEELRQAYDAGNRHAPLAHAIGGPWSRVAVRIRLAGTICTKADG